jgi:hypothetical protein
MPPRDQPEDVVLRLIDDNWTASDVYDVDVVANGGDLAVTFGWFSRENLPEITVEQASGGPVRGGETGISGINPDNGDATRTSAGIVPVHAWATRSSLEAIDGASTTNPRQFNAAVMQAIDDIVSANADNPTNPNTGNADLNYVGPGPWDPVSPETDGEKEPVFHYRYEVNWGWGPIQ